MVAAGIDGVYSYAGRTEAPLPQPLPTRVGSFGGIPGLVKYLHGQAVTHVIDATHPFAAQMSTNAVAACAQTGIPLLALERLAWIATDEDQWTHVPDVAAAVTALPDHPSRIFLAIGRQSLADFAAKPEHQYLLRLVDAPNALPLPNVEVTVSRGPFTVDADLALLKIHRIQMIVSKNSGGSGAAAKLEAARILKLPVLMIERPIVPDRPRVQTATEILAWLGHRADLGA